MPRSRNKASDKTLAADVAAAGDVVASGRHFTHFDASGQAQMVDVGGKEVTKRVARAAGRIAMNASTLAMVREGTAKKGDVRPSRRQSGRPTSFRSRIR